MVVSLPRPVQLLGSNAKALRVNWNRVRNAYSQNGTAEPIRWSVDYLLSSQRPPVHRFDGVQRYLGILHEEMGAVAAHHHVVPNQLEGAALRSSYYAVRHGISLPNERGEVCSMPHTARSLQAGLSMSGMDHAISELQAWWAQAGLQASDVVLVSSDYSRAYQTAEFAALCWGVPIGDIIVSPAIRERAFGRKLEGLPGRAMYPQVWAHDRCLATTTDMHIEGVGDVVVESAASVQYRGSRSVLEIDAALPAGKHVFLFSHGDSLQILQTAFAGIDASLHRTLPHLSNAEVRPLIFSA